MTTTAFQTETQKQEGAKPRGLVQIDLDVSGTLYISDQPITIGANTYRALIRDWGDILTGEKEIGNLEISLLNYNDATYGRFSNYDNTDRLTNAAVRVYKWFDGLTEADIEPLFKGVIDDFSYTLNEFRLSINDGTQQEHKPLSPKKLSFYDYPNAKQEHIGKPYPIIYGEPGEGLNSQKINKGHNSIPALLINKTQKKYLVAGHVTHEINNVVWIPLTNGEYAYLEGCSSNTGIAGNGYGKDGYGTKYGSSFADDFSTLILPEKLYCGYFISAIAVGNWFINTAQNPNNVCDRDIYTAALLNTSYPLLNVMVVGIDKPGTLKKIKIATSAAHTGCRTRWAGPKAKLYEACSSGATSIKIDSGAGMDASGYIDINGDRISYTSLTEDSSGAFWTVGGIPASGADSVSSSHSTNDPVVMVGDWLTLSTAEVDITSQRDWSNFDFYKFEVVIEWQSGADYTPSYVGFRIEYELSDYPDLYTATKGHNLNYRRNAIEQIKHIYINYLDRVSEDIGNSFLTAISVLENLNWKTDFAIIEEKFSKDIIDELIKECKGRFWFDGDNKPQIKIFQFNEVPGRAIFYDTEIVDPDRNGFHISNTAIDEVYNEIYLKFSKDYAKDSFMEEYYITPTAAYPADAARVNEALIRKNRYKTTNRLNVECPYIKDKATALKLLQYYFDYYKKQKNLFEFNVTLKHFDIQIGEIIYVFHPLNVNKKSMEVIKIIKDENLIKIKAMEYASDVQKFGHGYGKDDYGIKYGGIFTST